MGISLEGKNALVTGGTRGIGRAVTLALAEAGANVVTCYRSDGEHVSELDRQLKETSGQHHLIRADVSVPEEVESLIADCTRLFGSLDIVVNNAGVISHVPFEDLPLTEWHKILDNNLTSSFYVVQQALSLLGPGSSVVNVGSRVATVGIPLRSHYTAAKAGIVGLTRSMCKELGSRGIRVNVVAPGVTATEVELPEAVVAKYESMTAIRRLGTASEIASVVTFLASDLASYVTGETINVDGGI